MTTQSFLHWRFGSGFSVRRALTQIAVLLLALAPFPALAQGVDLPANIVRATGSLSAGDEDTLRTYVDQSIKDLSSDEPAKVRLARSELMKPLNDAEVGAPFRLSYSKLLAPALEPLVKDKREVVASNALRVAGEVASSACANIVMSQLDNPDPSVRYMAVRALSRTIEAVGRTAPAIDLETCNRITAEVGSRLEKEKDPYVADMMVRTLVAGVGVKRARFETLPTRALAELCKRAGDRTLTMWNGELDLSWADTLVVAGTSVRDRLAAAGQLALSDDARAGAARLAGDMLAYLRHLIKSQSLPMGDAESRERPRQIAALADTMVSLAAAESGGTRASLADLIKRADTQGDAGFLDAVSLVIGPDGVLAKKFNLPPARFDKK